MNWGLAGVALAALANSRFYSDEALCLPIFLRAMSGCFTYMAKDVSDMLESLRYHYGEHEEEAVSNA